MYYIGKIDRDIYKCVSDNIKTEDVIITEERVQHIKEQHNDDYEMFGKYIPQIMANPDYIVESNWKDTAVILKIIEDGGKRFKLILRLSVKNSPMEYKNSIISFWRIGESTWKKTLKNKKILYKAEYL